MRSCQNCKLIQPSVEILIKRRKTKNIKRIFILTLNGKDSRLNLFQKKSLSLLKDYNCFPFIGIDGRNKLAIKKILEHFFYALTMAIVFAIPVVGLILMLQPYFT